MEKIESAETAETKEDKKLGRMLKSLKKKQEAFIKSKKELVWHLAELSDTERQVLEKHESGQPLDGAQEGEAWARARRKIEDAKMRFKDLLDLPEII